MRTVFVSNRLPFTLKKSSSNTYQFTPSAGGLASALNAYIATLKQHNTNTQSLWVGWPGLAVSDTNDQKNISKTARAQFSSSPVFLDEEYTDMYYNGFCNQTIWPLFHYFLSYTQCRAEFWEAYQHVNEIFANHIISQVIESDTVLIQDYHLLLLPKLLRKKLPKLTIGFFLHIPFPSYEVFRILPFAWQKHLIAGMSGANLIGFHTQEYRQNFLESHQNVTGISSELGMIEHATYSSHTGAFPISIDVEYFARKSQQPSVHTLVKTLKDTYRNQKIIMSIDRLDYTKGIVNRLQGYEIFLKQNPSWKEKVVFLLTVIPSRDTVAAYTDIKKVLETLVTTINTTYGSATWTPVIYSYQSVDQDTLVSLYRGSDIGLLTPLRDGMNLVAKEFIACKKNTPGSLILSSLTGSALELPEALTVDPFYIDEIAEKIHDALASKTSDQIRKNNQLYSYLEKHTVTDWASSFQSALERAVRTASYNSVPETSKLLEGYHAAQSRLILLDYDGTLVPIAGSPEKAYPTPEVLTLLVTLSQDPANTVAIVSGRERNNLQEWFGKLSLTLVAEHGTWIKEKNSDWILQIPPQSTWKKHVYTLMETTTHTVPHSFIEKKEYGLAWHYRLSDEKLGEKKARMLSTQLSQFLANTGLEVIPGKKVIEVKHGAVNKGTAAQTLLSRNNYDCVIAIGDDRTDEDLFKVINPIGYTFKVGTGVTQAQYHLSHTYTVHKLLELLGNQNPNTLFMI